MVRAKFAVSEHRTVQWSSQGTPQTTVILTPQYDSSIEEDRRFAKATPSGRMELTIDNPPALAAFPLGSVHYVDFTVVPEPQPA